MTHTILVVDDNAEIREITKRILTRQGLNVITAAGGLEAIEHIKAEAPRAVILDVMMPEMSGWEVLDFIKNNEATAKIPVIMLTARNRSDEVEAGYEYGADLYLTKPVSKDQLLRSLGMLLQIPELLRASRPADDPAPEK